MKKKSIIATIISAVIFSTTMSGFSAFAENSIDSSSLTLRKQERDVIENCQCGSFDNYKDYIIPYSFEEFLALSEEEFLALENLPDSARDYYEQNSFRTNSKFLDGVEFWLNDDIVSIEETDCDSEAWQREVCEIVGIPFEIVQNVCTWGSEYPYQMAIKDEPYMGYPGGVVINRAAIYVEFQEAVVRSRLRILYWSPASVVGDVDYDGEIGVTDVVILQKWLLGSGKLDNWQSADLHEDGIINIYDLMLLKRMVVEQ